MNPPILVFAHNVRTGQHQARAAGLTWSHCLYVASPDTIRQLRGTKNLERHYFANWDLHPQARAIQDALYVFDVAEWTPSSNPDGLEAAGNRAEAGA